MSATAESVRPEQDAGPARRPSPVPRGAWLALGVLAVLVALLAGYTGGRLSVTAGRPGDGSPEAGFARDMSTHHAQAVAMGMVAYQRATDPEVRQLGYDIALTQENQIGIMQTWLRDWGLEPTGTGPRMAWMPNGTHELSPDGLMPGMATTAQLDQLDAATGRQVDILFCQLMLRHHLGGIHMVDGILALTGNQAVRDLAGSMKTGQQTEVNILRSKLAALGAAPLDG